MPGVYSRISSGYEWIRSQICALTTDDEARKQYNCQGEPTGSCVKQASGGSGGGTESEGDGSQGVCSGLAKKNARKMACVSGTMVDVCSKPPLVEITPMIVVSKRAVVT